MGLQIWGGIYKVTEKADELHYAKKPKFTHINLNLHVKVNLQIYFSWNK